MAKLALCRRFDRPAEHVDHQLHAIANPEYWNAEIEHPGITTRSVAIPDSGWSTREYDANWVFGPKLIHRRLEWRDLSVDLELAQASGYELCVLRTEIEDQQRLMSHARPILGLSEAPNGGNNAPDPEYYRRRGLGQHHNI